MAESTVEQTMKWMTLLYASAGKKPNIDGLVKCMPVLSEDYYIVRKVPLIEMMTKEPVDIAEELIGMTADTDWQMQTRRPITVGDVIGIGDELYLLVKRSVIVTSAVIQPLPSHKDFGLIRLPLKQFEEILCNKQTSAT